MPWKTTCVNSEPLCKKYFKNFLQLRNNFWHSQVVHAKVARESFWIYGCGDSSQVSGHLRHREVAQADNRVGELVALVRACAKNKDLCRGAKVHDAIVKRGLLKRCTRALITMYVKCGALGKAKELFDMHKSMDVVTCTAIIAGYAKKGQGQDALKFFDQMEHEGVSPNALTLTYLLKACARLRAIDIGEQIHMRIAKSGLLGQDIVLGNALVGMYAKCGALTKARQVLEKLPIRDVVSWNVLIGGYTQHGQAEEALGCVDRMSFEGLFPDRVTFLSILKACGNIEAIDKGKQFHDEIVNRGLLGSDVVLGTALVDMYVRCGVLTKAQQVLEELPVRDVISWNALISGYVQQGQAKQALNCFEQMQCEGHSPDIVTFLCILKACGSIGALDKGEVVHDEITRQGLLKDNTLLGNVLLDMYVKCGALSKAQQVLEKLGARNVLSWNALIAGYALHGPYEQAFDAFELMQTEGISPNDASFISILKACSSLGALDKGRHFHDEIIRHGLLQDNVVLGTTLVDMYVKCDALNKAQQVLDKLPTRNEVSWNALIVGYTQGGQSEDVFGCLRRMEGEGLSPNAVTFCCILKACGIIGAADKGERVHHEIIKMGLLAANNVELGNALVDMYAKCSALQKAQQVLEELPVRDVVSWSALLAGYAEQGHGEQALSCFVRMRCEGGFVPDGVTFISILKACGSIRALEKGKEIHEEIAKLGLLANDILLGTAVVDMYVKCGALQNARTLLEDLSLLNVVSWNALITGYVQQGLGELTLSGFEQMCRKGLVPNAVTFSSVLKACGAIGAVDKGGEIHDEIAKQGLLHINSVLGNALVDMYAKCGAMEKARQVLEELPARDVITWSSLIVGYTQQGQVKQALECFKVMQQEGHSPDMATWSSVLNACSLFGLVEEAQTYYENMSTKYGIVPSMEHYTCMVDLFARSGYLGKAAGFLGKMSYSDAAVWSTLLGACQKWGDVSVGKWAFEQAMKVERSDSAAYVLMGNIYATAGMPEDADRIEAMRMETVKQSC